MNARFFCTLDNCGRGFHTEEDLKIHIERRHDVKIEKNPEEINQQQEKIKQRLFGNKIEPKIPVVPAILTAELILETSGQESLDDITELILRNKNLQLLFLNL